MPQSGDQALGRTLKRRTKYGGWHRPLMSALRRQRDCHKLRDSLNCIVSRQPGLCKECQVSLNCIGTLGSWPLCSATLSQKSVGETAQWFRMCVAFGEDPNLVLSIHTGQLVTSAPGALRPLPASAGVCSHGTCPTQTHVNTHN